MDQDYIDKLSPDEKAWLSKFMDEYMGGHFPKSQEHLHESTEEKRDCYNRNNARNRDLYARVRTNNLDFKDNEEMAKVLDPRQSLTSPEDSIIKTIDAKQKEERKKK